MSKLDGSSVQLVYTNGKPTHLYTRGDGIVGGDISFLIPHLNVPKSIPRKAVTIFRIEAVINEKTFNAKWQGSLNDGKFETARNMVNGLLNRKLPHPALADVSMVVLGVYDQPFLKGLLGSKKLGFEIVSYEQMFNLAPNLAKALILAKKTTKYSIDGLVVCSPLQVMSFVNADKPSFLTAYKENVSLSNASIATVEEIIWQTSSNGRLIPKARITPLHIGGVTIKHVTMHNAAWMLARPVIAATKSNTHPVQFPGHDLLIGLGSQLRIVRSGDVIPKIVEVITAGKLSKPKVPFKLVGVHYQELTTSVSSELDKIEKFFVRLGVEFIASKTIETLYSFGLTSSMHYMKYWKEKTLATKMVDGGLGITITNKIIAEFDRVFGKGLTVMQFMVAGGQFEAGLGERKLQYIVTHYDGTKNVLRDILNVKDKQVLNNMLVDVPMWSQKTIQLFLRGLVPFRKWLKEAINYVKIRDALVVKNKVITGSLTGSIVTFTGYRDVNQELLLVNNGAIITDFNSKTTILLYKADGKLSTKLQKAKDKGVTVTTYKELFTKFKLISSTY
jgi:DNA ligase (NAD+)